MTDRVPPETRSRVMSSVKSSGTKLERRFEQRLREAGLEGFLRNYSELPGKPDFVFPAKQVAVFVDSCFWHGCPSHLRMPESRRDYWEDKIARTRARDQKRTDELTQLGWKVVRVWEHDLDSNQTLAELEALLGRAASRREKGS